LDTTFGSQGCNRGATTILFEVSVTDDHDSQAQLDVRLNWTGKYLSGSTKMNIRGPVFYAVIGPYTYQQDGNGAGDSLSVSVTATDTGKESTTINGKAITVLPCNVIF
jgi:hypothetical protein